MYKRKADFQVWMDRTFDTTGQRITIQKNEFPTQLRFDQVAALIQHLAAHLDRIPVMELTEVRGFDAPDGE